MFTWVRHRPMTNRPMWELLPCPAPLLQFVTTLSCILHSSVPSKDQGKVMLYGILPETSLFLSFFLFLSQASSFFFSFFFNVLSLGHSILYRWVYPISEWCHSHSTGVWLFRETKISLPSGLYCRLYNGVNIWVFEIVT